MPNSPTSYDPYTSLSAYSTAPFSVSGTSSLAKFGHASPSAHDDVFPSVSIASSKAFGIPIMKSNISSKLSTILTKICIKLLAGFAWNYKSLALPCRWKEVSKKGTLAIVASGDFHGQTTDTFDAAWLSTRP